MPSGLVSVVGFVSVVGLVGVVGARGGCQLVRALLPRLFLCLGGIATIGVRHAGDTPSWGFYGRKTPRWALGGAVDCRCCAQRAVHLGRMRRKRGVWGEVDYVVGAVLRCWVRAIGRGRADVARVRRGNPCLPSSYTHAELTTSRAERCCVASECGIGEHTRQRVRELIRTLLSVPQSIDAVVARGFCH